MKISNTQWKVIAAVAFAVIVTICAGRVIEAKTGQDFTVHSARVTPQVREAAINALGPIGFTRGQTLRIGLLNPGPHVVLQLTVFDRGGNTLINSTVNPGPPNTSSFFDLNADQLPQAQFDNSGRAEVTVSFHGSGGGEGSFSASAQVFDNLSGKTTFALQAGGHPGGVN